LLKERAVGICDFAYAVVQDLEGREVDVKLRDRSANGEAGASEHCEELYSWSIF
jgi:hypothetical protein